MRPSSKVLLNSVILYIKLLITMAITLVSVPVVLRSLGESDYGLYNLIAGVIAMLAFLNASMSISTQRFLSVAIGKNDTNRINSIFNVGIVLHLLIGLVVVLLFEICFPFLFNDFLNIPPERILAGKLVYQFLVINTLFSILTVPFEAALNAKENMLTYSLINILSSCFKLALAFSLLHCSSDRLITYALGMAIISILVAIVNYVYVTKRYKDFSVNLKCGFNKEIFSGMLGFTGWSTFGAVATLGRNQGIAIIINLFFGTIANAAYGIANQINGALSYFSSNFQKAINPQLMQSAGMNNRNRLIMISYVSSKYSVIVLSLFAIPLIIEMHYVLKMWLGTIPEYTFKMSQWTLVLAIAYQYSAGLMSSIQAIGKIRNYFIVMSVLILLNIPISFFLMKSGLPIYYTLICCVVIEFLSFLTRLFMAHRLVGINIKDFLYKIFLSTLLCICIAGLPCLLVKQLLPESFLRFVIVSMSYLIMYLVSIWYIALNDSERNYTKSFLVKVMFIFSR